MNSLLSQFHNFVSVVREFAVKCRLRCVSTSCRCNGGGHTHIQGRTASGDSSSGENISPPGLRCCETTGLRGDAWVREFQTAHHSENARVVSSRGFSGAARFSPCSDCGSRKEPHRQHSPNPVHALLTSLFCTLVMQSCGVRTLPVRASE